MRKPKPRIKPLKYCRDCAHAVNEYNRSFATGEPIMAECEVKDFDVMLTFEACDEFKQKQIK